MKRFPSSQSFKAALAVTALSISVLPGIAQSQTQSPSQSQMQSPGTTTPSRGGMSSSSSSSSSQQGLASADASLLKNIAQTNMAEIEAGKVAVSKSQSAEVKQFAQMMIDDHTKALSEVQELAQAKNVKLPNGPDVMHKGVMVEYKALRGNTFDSRYMKQSGLGDHEATVKLLKKTQDQAKDADLKALATKMLPVVEGHLQHAQQLAQK